MTVHPTTAAPAPAAHPRPADPARRPAPSLPRRARRRPPWPDPRAGALAAAAVLVLAVGGAAVGHTAMGSLPLDVTGGLQTADADWTLGAILARNLGAALLMFSGAVSGGTLTAVMLPLVGVWVGATSRLALDNAGWEGAVGATALYAPLEFVGILLAAVAGLLPLASALLPPRRGAAHGATPPGPLRRYTAAVPSACLLVGLALALIVVAGVVEHLVVSAR